MPTYDVEIRATVRKTIRVEAASEIAAEQEAHGVFNILEDGTEEEYDQETLSIELVEVEDA